ncbi:polyprenyl synthetase family protein [bacterium]|nr:polyprenyl synthetase family protein [bacterium]
MLDSVKQKTMESFAEYAKNRLGSLQLEIENALKSYLNESFGLEGEKYHDSVKQAILAYKDVVSRPAKRLRGAFVLESFNMFSDKQNTDIVKVAVAIELIHAYLLLIDDFNDKSDLRRGLPTAHRLMETYYHQNHKAGDALHYGYSIATAAGLVGNHHASNLLLSLNFPQEILIRAMKGVNDTINITAYGQIRDIYNQQLPTLVENDVLEAHNFKTARYTYFNPIQLGATLAGQTDDVINKFETYTKQAGIAFQIQDDILGVFGDTKDTGKSNMDDIMEGKATLLTIYALNQATPTQREVLSKSVGNRELTPEDFAKVQQIIVDTGSLEHSKTVAHKLVTEAKESMYKEFPEYIENDGFKFITGIADYMIERKF